MFYHIPFHMQLFLSSMFERKIKLLITGLSTHIKSPFITRTLGRRDLSGCFLVRVCAFYSSYSSYFAFLCTLSKIFRAKMEPKLFIIQYPKLFLILVLHLMYTKFQIHNQNTTFQRLSANNYQLKTKSKLSAYNMTLDFYHMTSFLR